LITESKGIAGLVLASGMSTRFGPGNKLLAKVRGRTLVRRTVDAYVRSGLDPIVVVVGFEADLVMAELPTEDAVRTVHNPDFGRGQSRALVCGISNLPKRARAAVIGVGDQPFLTAGVIRSLVEAYDARGAPIVAPLYGGRRGNPTLFDRTLFRELLDVTGDQGGRPVIQRHVSEVEWVEVGDEEPGVDVDTWEDLKSYEP
jgi:molybdenum cofactor cytidylyltransferase